MTHPLTVTRPGRDSFRIVYARGDIRTGELVISDVWDYEENQYILASRKKFYDEDEAEAEAYAKQLAKDNGLIFIGKNHQAFLD